MCGCVFGGEGVLAHGGVGVGSVGFFCGRQNSALLSSLRYLT